MRLKSKLINSSSKNSSQRMLRNILIFSFCVITCRQLIVLDISHHLNLTKQNILQFILLLAVATDWQSKLSNWRLILRELTMMRFQFSFSKLFGVCEYGVLKGFVNGGGYCIYPEDTTAIPNSVPQCRDIDVRTDFTDKSVRILGENLHRIACNTTATTITSLNLAT